VKEYNQVQKEQESKNSNKLEKENNPITDIQQTKSDKIATSAQECSVHIPQKSARCAPAGDTT
jgi:hypothetical protein